MPPEEVLQVDTAPNEVSPQAVQDQLQRLLESPLFMNSRRYPSFLRYVVDQALEGRGGDLKERTIGIEVFGRKPKYDLAADPVVRQTAGEVRKRLAQYYYEPAHLEELRIELHPGSYNPEFKQPPNRDGGAHETVPVRAAAEMPKPFSFSDSEVTPGEVAESAPALEPMDIGYDSLAATSPVSQKQQFLNRTLTHRWPLLAALCSLLLVALVVRFIYEDKNPTALDQLWGPLLKSSGPVLISVGSWAQQSSTPNAVSIESHAKTSGPIALADTVAIAGLQQFLSGHQRASSIQTAAQTSFSDLQRGPVILVSAFDNPWTMRITDPLRFHFVQRTQTLLAIEDRKDTSRNDWQIDTGIPYAGLTRDFGLVARFHDPTTGQVVVVVAGIGENGTLAAGKVLTSEEFLQLAGRDFGLNSKYRNMEAVVETQVIDGTSGPPRIDALTFW